jgi:hypothetical protein
VSERKNMRRDVKSNVRDISQTAPSSPEAGREVAKVQELNDATLKHISGGADTFPKKVFKVQIPKVPG